MRYQQAIEVPEHMNSTERQAHVVGVVAIEYLRTQLDDPVCLLLLMVGVLLKIRWISTAFIAITITGGFAAFIHANTGNRFKRQ